MIGPVVQGAAVPSKVLLVGQAPGPKEGTLGRPFAWTAGKTMFKWFAGIGLPEEEFRARVFIAAVCRCFPGKNKHGGDRVPSPEEIENCSRWLNEEIGLLKPKLVIPVGKLAISLLMPVEKLDEVIGRIIPLRYAGEKFDAIPLPHPSGASTWHVREPGKTLLNKALRLIARHPAFRELLLKSSAVEAT